MGFWRRFWTRFAHDDEPADVDRNPDTWYNEAYANSDPDTAIGDCCGNCSTDSDVAFILERLEAMMTEFETLKASVADAVVKMSAATAALVAAAGAPKPAEVQALTDSLKPAVDALVAATPAP